MSADGGNEVEHQVQPQQQPQSTQQQQPPQQIPLQPYLFCALPFTVMLLVLLIRALPWPVALLERRPLSCQSCLSLWSALVVGFGLVWLFNVHWSWALLHLLPAPGAAVLLLAAHSWLTAPRELPLPPRPRK